MAITPGGRVGDASPLGKKGPRKLTDYTREIAHALMRRGVPKSRAIAIARGAQARWARGGGRVRPQVRAAAARSTVEQHVLDHVKTGRRGGRSRSLTSGTLSPMTVDLAQLSTKKRKQLPKSSFAVPGKRAYPIPDRSHAANALARVQQHGTPAQKAAVQAAVARRYPDMPSVKKKSKSKKRSGGGVPAALKAHQFKSKSRKQAVSLALAVAEARRRGMQIDLVGPKGYVHGWRFVGVPGSGAKIRHSRYKMPGASRGKTSSKIVPPTPKGSFTPRARKRKSADFIPNAKTDAAKEINRQAAAHAKAGKPVIGKAGSGQDLQPGDRVQHPKYGLGTVTNKSGRDETVRTEFKNHGTMYVPSGELRKRAPRGSKSVAGVKMPNADVNSNRSAPNPNFGSRSTARERVDAVRAMAKEARQERPTNRTGDTATDADLRHAYSFGTPAESRAARAEMERRGYQWDNGRFVTPRGSKRRGTK